MAQTATVAIKAFKNDYHKMSENNIPIQKIAALANIYVSEAELPELSKKLGTIMNYIESLKEVDVSSVEPMSHVHGSSNVFREDIVKETAFDKEKAEKNFPDATGTFIKVPIIIE